MAKPAKPAAAKKEEAPAEAPKSNKKMIIIAAAAALLIGGGAAWYFMKGNNANHAEEKKVEAPKEPTFIPLEAFTVNLQHEESSDQYLQVTLALKVLDPALTETIKAVLPEIRSKLNLLLSSKRASELSTVEGKKKLAEDIVTEANSVLGIHNEPAAHAAAHAPVPASTPVTAPEVVAASAPAEGEAPAEPAAEGEAASAPAPVAAAPAPVAAAPVAPAVPEKKGVVEVLFTSFIIQ